MARKAQKKESPTIVAVEHVNWAKPAKPESIQRLKRIFERASKEKKRRTLFIELDQELIERFTSKEIGCQEAFHVAVNLAKGYGWKIVALDKRRATENLQWPLAPKLSKDELLKRKHGYNLREKSWARKIRLQRAGENDFVVMHPNHVRGFLIESGIKGKKVVWIDRPETRAFRGLSYGKRLNARERRQLKRRKASKGRKLATAGKRPR